MKELSIEEKAKRYDEAIKVAKSNYETIVQMDKDCTFAKEGIVNTFHHMFPELKESEDEKVRKAIIEHFEGSHSSMYPYKGFTKEQILAWLERQGEQKPTEEYNITGIGSKHAEGKLGEMIKNLKPINEVLEQKSWSEEDEKILNLIIARLHSHPNVEVEEYGKDYHWFKSLKARYTWKPSELQIEALESATENCAYSEYQDCLRELIGQLKKLRE